MKKYFKNWSAEFGRTAVAIREDNGRDVERVR